MHASAKTLKIRKHSNSGFNTSQDIEGRLFWIGAFKRKKRFNIKSTWRWRKKMVCVFDVVDSMEFNHELSETITTKKLGIVEVTLSTQMMLSEKNAFTENWNQNQTIIFSSYVTSLLKTKRIWEISELLKVILKIF